MREREKERTYMNELRRAHEEPQGVHDQRHASDRSGKQHAHEDDHRASLLASKVKIETGRGIASHEAHKYEQNHGCSHDTAAIFGR